ncbi:hypothetical protein A2U01_0099921, partial [Trifolium medium]|nr:hypothetical protein [Trifolium medium]
RSVKLIAPPSPMLHLGGGDLEVEEPAANLGEERERARNEAEMGKKERRWV